MEKKWLINETTTVDQSTGEVLTTSKKFAVKIDSEEFYMTFVSCIAPLFKLKSAIDIKLLIWLCKEAEFNTGRVLITPEVRIQLLSDLDDISSTQVSKSLASLSKKELIKGTRGTYYINPLIFWKGHIDTRKDYMRNYSNFVINFNLEA